MAQKKGAKNKVVEDLPVESQLGVFIFPNGDKYEGETIQLPGGSLERSGTGTHSGCDGRVYEGQWSHDQMNGEGRLRFPSGAVYEGQFEANRFQGEGRYTWPNGSHFKGTFNDNKMEGNGVFVDTYGQTWTGNFFHRAAPGLRYKLVS